MKNIFSSVLLPILMVVVFTSEVFAQSAKEAAKYGELQEIQVVKPGSLKKSIKKGDSTITALKLTGQLDEKDLDILFSLPNIAYLDLEKAKNIATYYEYKIEKEKKSLRIDDSEFPLMCSNSLKYLVLPEKTKYLLFPLNITYNLDMLVIDGSFWPQGNLTYENLRVLPKYIGKDYYSDERDALTKVNNQYVDNHKVGMYTDKQRIDIKTLYISTDNWLKSSLIKHYNPSEIVIESTRKRILNNYSSGKTVVDLSDFDEIREYALAYSNVQEVNLGTKIKELPLGCFYGCKSLRKINMPSVKKITKWAFAETEKIIELVLPATVEEIDAKFIEKSNVKKIYLTDHQYPPTLVNYESRIVTWTSGQFITTKHARLELNEFANVEFIIPKGTLKNYQLREWEDLHFMEYGAQDTYSFQLNYVGALKQYLTDDIIPNVRSLTLSGVMGETEFGLIQKCTSLKYLNLRNCFTFEETQAAKERYLEAAAIVDLLSFSAHMSSEVNQMKYENNEISTEEAMQREMVSQVVQSFLPSTLSQEELDKVFGSNDIIYRPECHFPKYALEGLPWLEEVIFPQKYVMLTTELFEAKEDMQNLKKVEFSNETVVIGDGLFAGASNLKNINIPDTLMILGKECFAGCAIEKVDLSNTLIKYWVLDKYSKNELGVASYGLTPSAFKNCPLKEFRTPRNIDPRVRWTEYIYDKPYENHNPNMVTLYFYFNEPFCKATLIEEIYGKIKEIHVPRGTKGAWRGYSNLIDDL